MPNAVTHDAITIVTAAALAPVALNTPWPDMGLANAVVLTGAYLASGLLFSPDLDTRSTPYKRWGLFRWLWLPYRYLVPHRSWVSHSFFFGPLLRIVYLAAMLSIVTLIVFALINLFSPIDPSGTLLQVANMIGRWLQDHPWTIAYILLGFVLGGASHTIADLVWSGIKRRLKRQIRRLF
ncbi:MAG: hypothetical protein QOH93_46 [Chloroflexia bacterium]|jgi:uncharacterized metal-binding protein|nr:hypothetical protein [Chloroflexia bacterium]